MKLLYLHQFDLNLSGGSGVYLRAVSAELAALGHHVDVVSARLPDRYGLSRYALPFDFTLTFGPEKRRGERTLDELSAIELKELPLLAAAKIKAEAFGNGLPDLVVVNHISLMAEVARCLNSELGLPYRIISHGTDTQLLVREARYRELFAEAARGAECIFAISRYVAKQVESTVPARKIKILGGGVDSKIFYPAPRQPTVNAITYVGRLVTEKGIWTLLDAHQKLTRPVELNVIGEGPLMEAIKGHLANASRRARVNVLGFRAQDQIRDTLARSALLVMPSTWQEPLGLVALEALACGVPVVASEVGGIPEIVRHGVEGYLIPPGDADKLAKTIDHILGNQALRQELQEGVRAKPIPTYADLARIIVQ